MTNPMISRSILPILCLLIAILACPALSGAENVPFLTIIDGDSILVKYKGRPQQVRLIGIDAPEWGQEYGTQAKSHALRLCYGKRLRLEFDNELKDRYGRLLAYVYCDDKMLNEELVKAGMAIAIKVKPNTKYYTRLVQAEKDARAKRNGFWLHGGLQHSPAQWRKIHKK